MVDNPDGEQQPGLIHAGLRLAGQVTHSLAPQFLALILVNLMFLGGLFWFVDARATHTAAVLNQLLSACLEEHHRTP
jgi:hypothetical protein